MKRMIFGAAAVIMVGSSVFAADKAALPKDEKVPALELTGSVQVQAQRALWENFAPGKKHDNLDEFWGRANLGVKFKAKDFSSEVNIRAFPEGWGYEPLTGLVIKDSTDTISLSTLKTSIAKFQIEQAWVKYMYKYVDVRVGRYFTTVSKTISAGNYLDQDPGMGFQTKIAYHNAVDVTFKTGFASTNVLLGATDLKLNTGYLRVYETINPTKAFSAGIGYRANLFDLAKNEYANLEHRLALNAEYQVIPDLKPYVELGLVKKNAARNQITGVTLSGQKDITTYPVLVGVCIPTGGILNAFNFEVEYVDGREVTNVKDKKKVDSPLSIGFYVDKKLSARARFQIGLLSDAAGTSAGDMRVALRFTSALK
jgi:hypothetical protein